jgi:hypothetical protein
VFVAAAALLVTGCRAGSDDTAHDDGPMVCEPGFGTPAGFRATESFQDPYGDHVGIRLGFVDDEGRELHYFAGIPGEFGEGLPVVDTVPAAGDIEGPLQGRDTTWVLSWRAPGPCGVRAVIGNGFTQADFLETLEAAGIVPRD